MSEYNYGQFSSKHLETIKKGIELFNCGKFWECHEELEEHWLEDTGDNARYIYWAVIQIAAALFHYEKENIAGAKGMINKAKEKFSKSEELGVETSLVFKYLSWEILKKIVNEIPNDCNLNDFKKLNDFKFQNPSTWKE